MMLIGVVKPDTLHHAFHTFALFHCKSGDNVFCAAPESTGLDVQQLGGTLVRCAFMVHPGKVFVAGPVIPALMDVAAENGVVLHFLADDTNKAYVAAIGGGTNAVYTWISTGSCGGDEDVGEPLPGLFIKSKLPVPPMKLVSTVGFAEKFLNHRGTMRAARDYSTFLRSVLNIRTVLFIPKTLPKSFTYIEKILALDKPPPDRFETIRSDFDSVVIYESSLGHATKEAGVDMTIMLLGDWVDWQQEMDMPPASMGVHCVFFGNNTHPPGSLPAAVPRSAVISACVPSTATPLPTVPHIVWLPPVHPDRTHAVREAHGIPADAFVAGRHGGWETFDVPFVWEAIQTALARRPNLYMLFMNTCIPTHMQSHPRVIIVEATACKDRIAEFVLACDIMLHARVQGETFGLACAEFAYFGKPVCAYETVPRCACHHLVMLTTGGGVATYKDSAQLIFLLTSMQKDLVCYRAMAHVRTSFHPWAVMPAYVQTFIPCQSIRDVPCTTPGLSADPPPSQPRAASLVL